MTRFKKIAGAAAGVLSAGLLVAAHAETPVSAISSSAFGDGHLYSATMKFDAEALPVASISTSTDALPEAPSAILSAAPAEPAAMSFVEHDRLAPKYAVTIEDGMTAQRLSAHDKLILSIRDTVSPFSFVSYVLSAGYSHVTNGQPNYGTNSTAFAQRFGATVARDATENILYEGVFASAFHQDPRYYVMGDSHNFFKRVIYSVTRPIITRTDGGHQTINTALLAGYAGGSALSYTYYSEINRNFHDTAATFGGSIAGAAVGDFVSEFWADALGIFHHKH